jgi:hypothetical protein
MVNVNVQLPPLVAASFPQAAEALHRQNQLQPAIPKTEETHAYTKMRSQQEREQPEMQGYDILQKGSGQSKHQDQSTSTNQRRDFFFASKLKLSHREMDDLSVELADISDFKQAITAIQAKYNNAVSPFPDPTVDYNI